MNGIELNCDSCCEHQVHIDVVNDAAKAMPPDTSIDKLAETFKIFGDATRIKIICALLNKELCVCDISELVNMSQSAISHQLRLLRNSRLVKTRREGKSVFYSLDDEHISLIINAGIIHINEEK